MFTDTDVEMLSDVVSFIDDGALEADLALQMARVIGSSLDRIATALVDAMQIRREARRARRAARVPGHAPQSAPRCCR